MAKHPDRWLQASYTRFAPAYDALLGRVTAAPRRTSLARLDPASHQEVLLAGIGTGLDIEYLPPGIRATGIDLTRAMLERAHARAVALKHPIHLDQGDARHLPYRDGAFDAVVLHLILAVVPDGHLALAEAARVTRIGGRLLILDKFLRRGALAPFRRLVNPIASRIASRTDVVFEDLLAAVPGLEVDSDHPAMLGGWFRHIILTRTENP